MHAIKQDDWNREGASIKLIIECINKRGEEKDLINLVKTFKNRDYSDNIRLSDADVALLYRKLLQTGYKLVADETGLLEDLVGTEEEYIFQVDYKEDQSKYRTFLPLITICMYEGADWKAIAYIQQQKEIESATFIKFERERFYLNTTFNPNPIDTETISFSRVFPDIFKKYHPCLRMGDAYIKFVSSDYRGCDEILEEIYKNFPQQVNDYLEYMAAHFTLALKDLSTKSEVEAGFKATKDWLAVYAEALKGMTETVVCLLNIEKNITEEDRKQALRKILLNIYSHLLAVTKEELESLDKTPRDRLEMFIDCLKRDINKVAPIEAQANSQFFTQPRTGVSIQEETEQTRFQF